MKGVFNAKYFIKMSLRFCNNKISHKVDKISL